MSAEETSSATFEFTISEEFFVVTHRRYRDSRPGRRRVFVGLKIVLGAFMVALIALSAMVAPSPKAALVVGVFITMLVGVVFATDLDEWIVRITVRGCDARARITLSMSGFSETISNSRGSETPWSAFTSARRMSDGFLLFRGRLHNWLPINALTRGSLEDADALIRRNVSDYRSL